LLRVEKEILGEKITSAVENTKVGI